MDGTLYKLMLVIHIISVALWLGSNLAMGLGSGKAVGASGEVNAWWAEVQGYLGKTLKNVAFILLLITGVVMVIQSDKFYEFKNPFVSVGFLTVIVGGALGGMVFAPGCRGIAEDSRNGDTAAAKAKIDKLGMFGAAESLLVVVTILFMVFKWGN
ncbi:MAG: hypothetical protein U0Q22_05710 [Acidimicrobiales bacterium]